MAEWSRDRLMAKRTYCISCGGPLPVRHTRYCRRCGAKNHCIDCGAEITMAAIRCRGCSSREIGSRLDSLEAKKKRSETRRIAWKKGTYDTEDYRQKQTDATRAAHARGCFDHIYTEETRQKQSDARIAYFADPENRKRISGENHPNWRGGISFEPYGLEFTETLREQIRLRQNWQCLICWLPNENGNALDVHHLDYDKINNGSGNLVALCASCHGATSSNRGYWQLVLTDLATKRGFRDAKAQPAY